MAIKILPISFLFFFLIPFFVHPASYFLSLNNWIVLAQIFLTLGASILGYKLMLPIFGKKVRLSSRHLSSRQLSRYSLPLLVLALFFVCLLSKGQLATYFTITIIMLVDYQFIRGELSFRQGLIFSILSVFLVVVFFGVMSKTLVVVPLLFFAIFLSRRFSKVILGIVVLLAVAFIFVMSALARDHPLLNGLSSNMSFDLDIIVNLFVARLNMFEPVKRIVENPNLFVYLLSDLPLSNSFFPAVVYDVFAFSGYDSSKLPLMFGQIFYNAPSVFVSTSLVGEAWGNFSYLGALVFFLCFGGLIAYVEVFSKYNTPFSHVLYYYFCLKVLLVGFEGYFSTTISQFILFGVFVALVFIGLSYMRILLSYSGRM